MKNPLITIDRFQYTAQAQIIKGRLEAEGIESFLSDHMVVNTDPLVSNAVGGVKLKVFAEDKSRALEVLHSIHSYSLNDQGEQIHCPNCNGTKIDYFTNVHDFKSFFSFILAILFMVLPLSTSYKYRCDSCKTKFDIK